MWLATEFTFQLKNGSKVIVSAEGETYRDENREAWIEGLEVGFSIQDTRHYKDAVNCLQSQMGEIKTQIEERLVESHDEHVSEAS